MNKKIRRIGTLALLMASVAVLAAWGQAPVYPLGLIIDPPESEVLEVSISTDKAEYQVGELVTISYEVSKAAYIYIWDILPTGQVQVVFPSAAYPGGLDNFVQAGEHQLPRSFTVAPPLGTEYLQILATTQPVDVSAFPMSDPGLFQQQVEVQILGLLLEDERTWNFTSFEITDEVPPNYGTLIITSTPPGGSITIDGASIGYTPRTHFVSQGLHRISISKPGYATWNAVVIIFGTATRTVSAELTPLFPTNSSPVASFTFDPLNPTVGGWVQFDGSSSFDPDGSIASYQWSYGDGGTDVGPVRWHQFTSGGAFSVTLTVTDNAGATDSATQLVQVGSPNLPPVASFTIDPLDPAVGVWVQFNASASFDPDGSIASYQWNYGDGGTDVGPVRWHQFVSGGTFSVTLTVTDNNGGTNSVTQAVQIGSPNLPPVASFTIDPLDPAVGVWVQFNASASFDPDGSIASYQWNYGDGGTDVGPVRWHQFVSGGTYSVTLTIVDDDGLSSAATQSITVGQAQQPPVASFTYSPLSPQVGQTITLNASSSFDPDGTLVSYRWDLNGDGITDASGPFGQVSFASPGGVVIRLEVTDDDGLSASTSQPIVIGPAGSPPGSPTGAPPMGTTAGVYVWGTDSWHVTVNAGAGWIAPHSYRLELRTNGSFQDVNEPSGGGVFPLGLIIDPPTDEKTLIFEGSIAEGSIDHTFRVPTSRSVWMSLKLDIDGDGILDESTSFVYLRHLLVHPRSVPLVVGLPSGSTAELTPSIDFRLGFAATYQDPTYWIFWGPTISELEAF